jgi:hypothetical protein
MENQHQHSWWLPSHYFTMICTCILNRIRRCENMIKLVSLLWLAIEIYSLLPSRKLSHRCGRPIVSPFGQFSAFNVCFPYYLYEHLLEGIQTGWYPDQTWLNCSYIYHAPNSQSSCFFINLTWLAF